jgi:hypothetical protein
LEVNPGVEVGVPDVDLFLLLMVFVLFPVNRGAKEDDLALAGLGSPDGSACLGPESVEAAVFVDVPDIDVALGYDEYAVGIQPLLMLNVHVAAEVVKECVVTTTKCATQKQKGGEAGGQIKFIVGVHAVFPWLVWGLWGLGTGR